ALELPTSGPAGRAPVLPHEPAPVSSMADDGGHVRETRPLVPAVETGASRSVPAAGARELEALVRAWNDGGQGQQEPLGVPQSGVPAAGDPAPPRATGASPARPTPPVPGREAEPLAFGDALGRVLVAELRRYGIEVDEG